MLVLGLTGSIGMGKTTTAQLFAQEGAKIFDADAAVHELYATSAIAPIAARFPGAVVKNAIDRAALAREITVNPSALKDLEAIIHPLVRQAEVDFIAKNKAGKEKFVVLDIPLLFESGGDELCDKIIVVTAPEEVQKQRVLGRPGMSVDKFETLLSRQMSDEKKRALADFVVWTDKGIKNAQTQVRAILTELGLAAEKTSDA